MRATDFNVHITRKRTKLLRTSQFPNPVIDAEGRAIYKPAAVVRRAIAGLDK